MNKIFQWFPGLVDLKNTKRINRFDFLFLSLMFSSVIGFFISVLGFFGLNTVLLYIVYFIILVLSLISIILFFILSIKRGRDFGVSGVVTSIFTILAIVGLFSPFVRYFNIDIDNTPIMQILAFFSGLFMLIYTIFFLFLLLKSGTKGENKYGEPVRILFKDKNYGPADVLKIGKMKNRIDREEYYTGIFYYSIIFFFAFLIILIIVGFFSGLSGIYNSYKTYAVNFDSGYERSILGEEESTGLNYSDDYDFSSLYSSYSSPSSIEDKFIDFIFSGKIWIIYLLLAIFPTYIFVKLTVYRLHDLNLSGWWILIVVGVLIVLATLLELYGYTESISIFGTKVGIYNTFGKILDFIIGVIALVVEVVLYAFIGTKGENKYGTNSVSLPKSKEELQEEKINDLAEFKADLEKAEKAVNFSEKPSQSVENLPQTSADKTEENKSDYDKIFE